MRPRDERAAGGKFVSAREFAKATAEWPVSRLAEAWNKLPVDGLKPVKKFMDRKDRCRADLGGHPELTPIHTPDVATGTKPPAKARKRPQSDDGAPRAREGSKKAIILAMLRNPNGATLNQIMEVTGWQSHYADVQIMPTCVGNPACGAVIAAMESA